MSTTAVEDLRVEVPPVPAGEYAARRQRVLDQIGPDAIAVVQGAPAVSMFVPFRQTNEFYYLSGVGVPHAYLLLDGRSGRTGIYLPHRDERRDANEGKVLSAEDEDEVRAISGVEAVGGPEQLALDLAMRLFHQSPQPLFTPFSPAESSTGTRDMLLGGMAATASDPWDGRPSREGHFARLLRERFPQYELHDLSPILDRLRLIKSEPEIARMREAGRLTGLGVLAAMQSTRPGTLESQLGATARYVFDAGGAQGEGYRAIVASGANTMKGHYWENNCRLQSGDLVLMDYAPDFQYYTSDIGRMWPVSGRFKPWQRELYDFIVEYHKQLLARVRPGATAAGILQESAEAMRGYLSRNSFSKKSYEEAASRCVASHYHMSHPVGMAVHDVGEYRSRPLEPGLVISVDPTIIVPEECVTIRVEDTVVVTDDGMENFTGFVPIDAEAVEAAMRGDGLLQAQVPDGSGEAT
jgi:Xaa-Pro aminopeptidase